MLGTAFLGLLGTINTFLRVDTASGAAFSISLTYKYKLPNCQVTKL